MKGLIGSRSRVWLFDALAEDDLARLCRLAGPKTYRPREEAVSKSDPADLFLVLLRARARVSLQRADGADTAINVMSPSKVFGEIGIPDGQPRSVSVTTLETCETAIDDSRACRNLLSPSPKVAIKLPAALAGRIRELTNCTEGR